MSCQVCTIADCRVQPLKSRTLFASQRLKQSTSAQGDQCPFSCHIHNMLEIFCNCMYQCELLAVLMLVSLINWKLEVSHSSNENNFVYWCSTLYHTLPKSWGHLHTQLLHNSGHDAPAHPLAKLCATSGAVPSVKGSRGVVGLVFRSFGRWILSRNISKHAIFIQFMMEF